MLEIKCNSNGLYHENTYFVTDKESGEILIIDPGTFDQSLVEAINDKSDVKYIIATHGHHDHIYALKEYRQAFPNAQFMYCRDDYKIADGIDADAYLSDQQIIPFGNTCIEIITTPGHTPGGICLLVDDNLFSGDTLFKENCGRTDLEGGDWNTLQSSIINKIYVLPEEVIVYPGHGDTTTIGHEKKANPFV